MKRVSNNILSFSLLVLAGCATGSLLPPASQQKHITWQRVSAERMNELCSNAVNKSKNGYMGCSLWNRTNDYCHVYTLDSLVRNSQQEQYVLGHETMHCWEGNFHK